MSDVWHPLDPEGSRQKEPSGRERGPDPEPIVRSVRVAFLLAGMVLAVMVNAGLLLEMLYDRQWELLTFAGISLLAGFVFQHQVAGAVRLAVDDPELRASYGSR